MRPLRTRKPFVLYKKSTKLGSVWYAKFWNEDAYRFVLTRSTGVLATGMRSGKGEASFKWLHKLSPWRYRTSY
jgi:hypothetical protein